MDMPKRSDQPRRTLHAIVDTKWGRGDVAWNQAAIGKHQLGDFLRAREKGRSLGLREGKGDHQIGQVGMLRAAIGTGEVLQSLREDRCVQKPVQRSGVAKSSSQLLFR